MEQTKQYEVTLSQAVGPVSSGPLTVSEVEKWATLDSLGTYRYLLGRRWAEGETCLWVMLNPSTADSVVDDPTIRRCVSFSQREGFGALEVVNLFAYRSTDPKVLPGLKHSERLGPDNEQHIAAAARRASKIICAWGSVNSHLYSQAIRVGRLILSRHQLYCLGLTSSGCPKHPVRLASNTPLVPFDPYRPLLK